MFMIRHGIDFHFRILNFVDEKDDALALSKETPINKVPILIDGEQKDLRFTSNRELPNRKAWHSQTDGSRRKPCFSYLFLSRQRLRYILFLSEARWIRH